MGELERTTYMFSRRLELDASPVVPSELRRDRKATPNSHRFDAKGATFHFPTYERSPTSSEMASTNSSVEFETFTVTPPPVEAPTTRVRRRVRHPTSKKEGLEVAKNHRTRRISRSALSQTLKTQGEKKKRTTQLSELAPLFESV